MPNLDLARPDRRRSWLGRQHLLQLRDIPSDMLAQYVERSLLVQLHTGLLRTAAALRQGSLPRAAPAAIHRT